MGKDPKPATGPTTHTPTSELSETVKTIVVRMRAFGRGSIVTTRAENPPDEGRDTAAKEIRHLPNVRTRRYYYFGIQNIMKEV